MFLSVLPQNADPSGDTVLSWTALPPMKDAHPAGTVQVGAQAGAALIFALTQTPPADALAAQAIAWPTGPALMRVDEVCFPVGAVAHRHTHSGAGFRVLVRGSLRIEADHHQVMRVGDSWFEPADTPVRAVALQDQGVTSFVRCMLVPLALKGQSTFKLADPADSTSPRLQMTHRHIDHPVYVDAG